MKTEKVFAAIIILALISKFILGWSGSGAILVISLSVLNLLYVIGAFYFFSINGLKNQNIILSIIGGLCLGCTIMGILFKIMYWPGSHEMLTIGIVTCTIILALSLVFHNSLKSKTKNLSEELAVESITPMNEYYRNLQLRSGIITAVAILFFITPASFLINLQYRNNPELARLKSQSYMNPGNEEYKNELKIYEDSSRNREIIKAK